MAETLLRIGDDRPDEDRLPIGPGACGPAVVDVRQRLAGLGYPSDDVPDDCYGSMTTAAVRGFQSDRGLHPSGVCDEPTWQLIVEAGHRLGDRLLYRCTPMLRGDDVAELQRRLSAFGFDPGRIDGIFGDQARDALLDFQRNAGLPTDGICGRRTVSELARLSTRRGGDDLVSPLREQLIVANRGVRGLPGRVIGVCESGGFSAGTAATCRVLRELGALARSFHHPDPSMLASAANAAHVECLVSLVLDPEQRACWTAYYSGYRYESLASRELARFVQRRLPSVLGLPDGGIRGMALPILRETRMPAVQVHFGAPVVIVQHTPELARVLVESLEGWIDATCA